MASRYWVGGTGTWDAADTTHWSATSGGASGASVPGSSDTVTFDGSSGGGTVTVGTGYDPSVTSIAMGTFTGTLDFSAFNNNPTMQSFSCTGTSTRALNMGNGTWTITGNNGSIWSNGTATGLTFNAGSSTVAFTYSGSSGTRTITNVTPSRLATINITAGTDIVATGNSLLGNVNFTGFTGTWGNSTTDISGNITLGAGMTVENNTTTTTLSGTGTQTFTSNGVTFGRPITQSGVGGTVSLADAFLMNTSRTYTHSNGTFITNNFAASFGTFASSGSSTRAITLGTSVIHILLNGGSWNISSTGMTFSGASATISMENGNQTFTGGGFTYGALTFASGNGGDFAVNSANTFGTFDYTPLTGSRSDIRLVLGANQVVTGTFTGNGEGASDPGLIKSSTLGTQRTITAAVVSISNISFMDIVGAGAGTWSGTNIGDAGNNSGITFRAPTTKYWVAVTGGNAASTASWSASSGGASGVAVPLPQDTVVFDSLSITSTGRTITWDLHVSPTIDLSNILNSPTLVTNIANGQLFFTGGLKLISAMTFTPTASPRFVGRGSNTITMAGKSFTASTTFDSAAGTYTLSDNFLSSAAVTHTSGTLTVLANYTSTSFSSSSTSTRAINMGPGVWTLTGTGSVFNLSTMTGLTFNAETSDIVISDVSASSKTIAHGSALALYDVTITPGGSGAIIFGANTLSIHTLNLNGGSKTLQFTAGSGSTTTIAPGGWNVNGISGSLVSLTSGTPGSPAFISVASGLVNSNYLSITNSTAQGGAYFQAVNSTNGGGNTGWNFVTASAGGGLSAGKKFARFGGARDINEVMDTKLHGYRKLGG